MIVYTEKLENAIRIASVFGGIKYEGRILRYKDITEKVLHDLEKDYAPLGYFDALAQGEKAMYVWGEDMLKIKNGNHLKESQYIKDAQGNVLYPADIYYEPVEGKEDAVSIISAILLNANHKTVVNACVGENALYTFMKLYEYCKIGEKDDKEIQIAKIDSLTEDGILDAFCDLISPYESRNQILAEKTKRRIYFLSNYTLKYCLQSEFENPGDLPFRYLPLLTYISQKNKKQEENTNKRTSFRIVPQAIYNGNAIPFQRGGVKLPDKREAEEYIKKLPTEWVIKEDREEVLLEDYANGPYNREDLLKEAEKNQNTLFPFSKTEGILQSLFEKGYIENINAKMRQYGMGQKETIQSRLYFLRNIPAFSKLFGSIDLAKIPDFYFNRRSQECGIIITEKMPGRDLSEDEKKIYVLIAKEMIKTAYPPMVRMKITVPLTFSDTLDAVTFAATSSKLISLGYAELEKKNIRPCTIPDDFGRESKVKLTYAILPERNAPPQLCSQSDILNEFSKKRPLFINAEILYGLSVLLEGEYIVRRGAKYISTDLGNKVLIYLSAFEPLLHGDLLGIWMSDLSKIAKCKTPDEGANLASTLVANVMNFLSNLRNTLIEEKGQMIGIKCPKCGAYLYQQQNHLTCNNCGWKIDRLLFGRAFSDKELAFLIAKKETPLIAGFSNGEQFVRGRVYLDERLSPVFTQDSIYSCPACGRKLYISENRDRYYCPSPVCSFGVSTSYYGHRLSKSEMRSLLVDKLTPQIEDFALDGRTFCARLYIDAHDKYKIKALVSKKSK